MQPPGAVDPKALLQSLQDWFAFFTPAEWRAVSSHDKSAKMVKTVLHTMCKQLGPQVVDIAKELPHPDSEQLMVERYIHLNLKHLSDNGLLPGQANAAPAPPPAALPPVEPAAEPAAADGQASQALSEDSGAENRGGDSAAAPRSAAADGGGPLQPSNAENVSLAVGLGIPQHLTDQVRASYPRSADPACEQ